MKEVPYIAHEAELFRAERTQRRLWIIVIFLTTALILTNGAWIIFG